MKRFSILFSILILLIFASCTGGGLLLGAVVEQPISASIVEPGGQLKTGVEIPVRVFADEIAGTIDLVLVEVRNEAGRLVAEVTYEDQLLQFPELPPLVFSNLPEGIYFVTISVFEDGENLGRRESWFFLSDVELEIQQITINPHSAEPEQNVSVSVEIGDIRDRDRSPYLQFRMNGRVVFEGVVQNSILSFNLEAPLDAGIYDLQLDLYPWFDERIDDFVFSATSRNLELLVVNPSEENEPIERIISGNDLSPIEGDPWFKDGERVASRLVATIDFSILDAFSPDTVPLFSINGETLSLETWVEDRQVMIGISRDESRLDIPLAELNSLSGNELHIDLLEGQTNFTVIVTESGRQLFGEVLSYSDIPSATEQSSTVSASSDAEGNSVPETLISDASVRELAFYPLESAAEMQALFQRILQSRYGNFLLYAEGFEFRSSVSQGISFSDEAYLEGGFLHLPPGAWVELPEFTLDEYLVEIEAVYHPEDDISESEMLLNQQLDERRIEIFNLNGRGQLRGNGLVELGAFNSPRITFALSKADQVIQMDIQDERVTFPSAREGRYRFVISQGSEAAVRIRLDSVSAANAPEELVDRLLEALP